MGEKRLNPTLTGSNSDSGGATNSAPQNAFDLLKQYAGKTVKIKAKGIFIEDLIDRFGKVLKTEVFNGYLEGKYRIQINAFGNVLLRYPHHIIEFKRIDFIEINGQEVRGE